MKTKIKYNERRRIKYGGELKFGSSGVFVSYRNSRQASFSFCAVTLIFLFDCNSTKGKPVVGDCYCRCCCYCCFRCRFGGRRGCAIIRCRRAIPKEKATVAITTYHKLTVGTECHFTSIFFLFGIVISYRSYLIVAQYLVSYRSLSYHPVLDTYRW